MAGVAGKTILSGTGFPGSGDGTNGDFYLQNPGTNPVLYGPKAGGAWPPGYSMSGVSGYVAATGSSATVVSGAATATATCASGSKVVAGGYLLDGSSAGGVITQNRATSTMVWSVTVANAPAASTLTATAYCIIAGP